MAEDIELIRQCLVAHRDQIDFKPSLQRIEQRIVDYRAVLDQYRRDQKPSVHYACLYYAHDELEAIANLLDVVLGEDSPVAVDDDWSTLNAFRTSFREAQYQLRP